MLSYPADMAELADAPDLGSGVERRAGSSPVIRTRKKMVCISSSSDLYKPFFSGGLPVQQL